MSSADLCVRLSLSVTPASLDFLSLLLPAGGSLSLARNFGEFQAAVSGAAAATPAAGNVSIGSGWFSRAFFIARLKVPPGRSGRRVGRPAPGPGSEGRGRGKRIGAGPASPLSGGDRAPAPRRHRPGFIPARSGSGAGRGDQSRPCASSFQREPVPGLRAGAGWARGGGRAAREGATVQPIGAAAGAPCTHPPRGPAAALFLPLWVRESGRAAGRGTHTGGRARVPRGEDALAHCCQSRRRAQPRHAGWWGRGRLRDTPSPGARGHSLEDPRVVTARVASFSHRVRRAPRPLIATFLWAKARGARTALSTVGFTGLQNKHRSQAGFGLRPHKGGGGYAEKSGAFPPVQQNLLLGEGTAKAPRRRCAPPGEVRSLS